MTKQRKLIHTLIAQSCEHPTAEMIYAAAKKIIPSIAVGTVYRNLKLMVDANEIRKISIPGEPDRYDRTLTPHGHMLCVNCCKVIDFSVEGIEHSIKERIGTKVFSYELSVRGICQNCCSTIDRSSLHGEEA